MLVQRYFANSKIADKFVLDSNDLFHIKTVMRMNNNDEIEVVYEKRLYLCNVEIDGDVNIIMNKELNIENQPNVELILAIPFLKEKKLDLIFQKGTELGVSKFILYEAERSIVNIDSKKEQHRLDRWSKICKEASEQSKRIDVPVVVIERKKDHFTDLDGIKLVCSPTEKEKNIKNVLKNNKKCGKIIIVVGPEGGLSDIEEIYFEKKGFEKVSLGARIMRTETVPVFLSSIISYEYME